MLLKEATRLFVDGYFATCHRSDKTKAAYGVDTDQFVASQPSDANLCAITPEGIESWALELRGKGYAPRSLRRKVASVRVFFNYCVRRRLIERSPLWQVRLDLGRPEPLTRTLSFAEIGSMLAAARAKAAYVQRGSPTKQRLLIALRNRALIEVMFATGMRVGEVASIRLADLFSDQQTLLVSGKGGRQRLAFLLDDLSRASLREYLDLRAQVVESTTAALFVNASLARLSTQGISDVIAQLAEEARIGRAVTPHMIRHTAATLLLRNGADIRVVQEFLGHTSISTTQRYTHVSKEHLLATLSATHPSMAGWASITPATPHLSPDLESK
jgi:integrase/recombinase XerD